MVLSEKIRTPPPTLSQEQAQTQLIDNFVVEKLQCSLRLKHWNGLCN